jgi:hypothetical protein
VNQAVQRIHRESDEPALRTWEVCEGNHRFQGPNKFLKSQQGVCGCVRRGKHRIDQRLVHDQVEGAFWNLKVANIPYLSEPPRQPSYAVSQRSGARNNEIRHKDPWRRCQYGTNASAATWNRGGSSISEAERLHFSTATWTTMKVCQDVSS